MVKVNPHHLALEKNYLFADIARKTAEFSQQHPDKKIIRLGIGDVTRALPNACVSAMERAAAELGRQETFHGYPPYEGYDFLRDAIARNDYANRGIAIASDEVFVSDGSKSDAANIQELFAQEAVAAITDPTYPVYVSSNIMAGRTRIAYMPCTAETGFCPEPPAERADLVYLCMPNNPTGTMMTREQLAGFVAYALKNKAIILYDGAYEAYITDTRLPHSIYEIPGAAECAIELRSFSKMGGFTGMRCAYMVIPKTVKTEEGHSVRDLWYNRQANKFNGVSYITQRGAEAAYTAVGQQQIGDNIAYYMENARLIREGLEKLGLTVFGGRNAPYIWFKVPGGMTSWDFFDKLLAEAAVVGTPGSGFGKCGEGYFRLTAFNTQELTREALERFARLFPA